MKKLLAIFVMCIAVFAANAQKSAGPAPRHQMQVKKTMVQEPMRSLQTEAIVALGGSDLSHFTLGTPSSTTSYGVSAIEFTNSCEYYNLNYYFATSTSGLFGTINPSTGVQTVIRTGNNSGSVAYNHANNTMYGLSLGSTSTLYTIDPATGEETQVVAITDDADYFMMAMTITNDGRFIVVNASRESIDELDPTTGTLTQLVPAGFNVNYGQDIAVDRETNTVYWVAYNADASEAQLYAVDLSAATLTLIGAFTDQASGFCPLNYSETELQRPAAVTNFTATPDANHALSVDLAWTNPTLNIGGENLTSLTSVELYRDGVLLHSFANPTVGGNMTYTDNTMTADGAYNYTVYAVNDAGNGSEAAARALVGNLCEYSIEMVDSWGDGWNGAAIEVYAGTTLMETATISSGTDATVLVPLPLGECSFVWVAGNYDSECSFTINDPFGVPVYVAESAPAAGNFLTIQNTCEAPAPFITPDPTSLSFSAAMGATSAASAVNIIAYGLGSDLTATTTAPFEVSFDNTTFATTATYNVTTETVHTTLYVRFAPTTAGAQTGTVVLSATNVEDVNISLTGDAMDCSAAASLPFVEDFEDELTDCWTNIDNDGDGYSWQLMTDYDDYAHSGSGLYTSASWVGGTVLTPDNWLITPKIAIPAEGANMEYWVGPQDPDYPEEHYQVMVSTTGTNVSDFTSTLVDETLSESVWVRRSVNLDFGGQEIYIAFVHNNCSDVFRINLDDINITAGTSGVEESELSQVSIYPNPATTMLNVRAENFREVQIINFLGQVVYSANITDNEFQINVSNLSNGVYFVRLNGETTTTQKFIKK